MPVKFLQSFNSLEFQQFYANGRPKTYQLITRPLSHRLLKLRSYSSLLAAKAYDRLVTLAY